jgi:hypothetical protein
MFLRPQKRGAKPPRLPRNSPRSHHEITIKKTPLFPKHPSKTPQNRKKPPSNRPTFLIQKIPPNLELIEPDSKPIKQEVVREAPRAKVSAHAAGTNPGSR